MSKIKQYYESLANLAATAIYEECRHIESYYEDMEPADIEEEIFDQFADGNIEGVTDELIECMFAYDSDLAGEFPKSFSAVCSLLPLVDSIIATDNWHSLIAGASNFPVFKALIDAYEEYRDMGDPGIEEAKKWIGELMYNGDYSGLLSDIDSVIESYELEESESPITFKAKNILEFLANGPTM